MAKNILIVPSNTIAPQPDNRPFINFENTGLIKLVVRNNGDIAFSSATESEVLLINEKQVKVGNNLNVNIDVYLLMHRIEGPAAPNKTVTVEVQIIGRKKVL